MIDERPPSSSDPAGRSTAWSRTAPRWAERPDTPLRRFLGGPPLAVVIKLIVVSVIVGAMLMWLNIRPVDVVDLVRALGDRLWALGFSVFHDFGTYLIAGAIIVVPVWLVLRVLSYRPPR